MTFSKKSRNLGFSPHRKCIKCVCMHTQLLSRVQLFANAWTVALQAALFVEFFRQEYWSGCHFLLQQIFLTQESPALQVEHTILMQLKWRGPSNFQISYFPRSHKAYSCYFTRKYEIVVISPLINMFFSYTNLCSAVPFFPGDIVPFLF